ncbi:MAG TPA: cupredoxin domain-containing protein [Actinomycetota bacterium]|nr:cupredoxin domain-containing protein [Actinomycetota bacterium]
MSRESRDRLLLPALLPILAILIIAILVIAMSRVLLAVPHEMATPIALGLALNVLTGAALIASWPSLRGKAVVAMLVVVGLVVVGGGVTAMAVSGELHELREALARDEVAPEGGLATGEQPGPGETGEQGAPGETGEPPPPVTEPTTDVVAQQMAFDVDELLFVAGEATTLTFRNEDAAPHNIAIYTEPGAETLFSGEVFSGPDEREYEIPAMEPGRYYFHCDVHPPMNGAVTVG